jgi:hypothetical protein
MIRKLFYRLAFHLSKTVQLFRLAAAGKMSKAEFVKHLRKLPRSED